MVFHPARQIAENRRSVLDAVLQEGRSHHGDLGTRHHGLDDIFRCMDAAGDGKVRFDVAVDDGRPVQAKEEFFGLTERKARKHFHLFDVEIRLIEAIEEDKRTSAGQIEIPGKVRRSRDEIG